MRKSELTQEDRAAAEELALLLGVSSDELIEEFENLTPQQQAELEEVLAQFNEAAPAMFESLDRMSETIERIGAGARELKAAMANTDRRLAKIEQSIEGGALNFRKRAAPDDI